MASDAIEALAAKAAAVGPDAKHVFRPNHYARFAIEPVEFSMRNDLAFWAGNVIKYVVRAGFKTYEGMDAQQSEITDLKKARRYIDMRINQLEGKDPL